MYCVSLNWCHFRRVLSRFLTRKAHLFVTLFCYFTSFKQECNILKFAHCTSCQWIVSIITEWINTMDSNVKDEMSGRFKHGLWQINFTTVSFISLIFHKKISQRYLIISKFSLRLIISFVRQTDISVPNECQWLSQCCCSMSGCQINWYRLMLLAVQKWHT